MGKKTLKIYYTSDTHGYFYPENYGSGQLENAGLFSCVGGYEKDENTLVIDGGDSLQGNALTYYLSRVLKSPEVIAKVMNDCGYDYYTLGNHDFNYGLDYQKIYRDNYKGRLVCQNILDADGKHLYPYDVRVLPNGLSVGIVGIVTDYINVWEKKEHIEGIKVVSPFDEAKAALSELKGKTDVNICIYHGGFECDVKTGERLTESPENVGYKICRELEFDVVFTGHQHMSVDGIYIVSDNTGHRTYTIQPLEGAKEYCRLIVDVEEQEGENRISVTSEKIKADYTTAASAQKVTVAAGDFAKGRENLYEKYLPVQDDIQKWLNEPVGTLSRELLPSDRLEMARNGSPIADFINRVQIYFSGAQISAVGLANTVAGFKRKVSTRDIIATYPFPNTLVVLRITGADLKLAIERSAEYFDYDEAGNLIISQRFLYPKIEHYNYDYFYGVDYEIDPKKPLGSRVVKLSHEGMPVAPEQEFTLCLNNYRATSAGEYPMYKRCSIVKEINIEMVELLMEYFRLNPVVTIL